LQLGMFVSPVIYDLERIRPLLTDRWVWLYEANPVACCIGLFRWSLLGTAQPSILGMTVAAILTIGIGLSGLAWFQHADQQLADRI